MLMRGVGNRERSSLLKFSVCNFVLQSFLNLYDGEVDLVGNFRLSCWCLEYTVVSSKQFANFKKFVLFKSFVA